MAVFSIFGRGMEYSIIAIQIHGIMLVGTSKFVGVEQGSA